MEKYVITFEDGLHYVATEITEADINAFNNGLLSIIRCSDCTEMNDAGKFVPLKKWEEYKK